MADLKADGYIAPDTNVKGGAYGRSVAFSVLQYPAGSHCSVSTACVSSFALPNLIVAPVSFTEFCLAAELPMTCCSARHFTAVRHQRPTCLPCAGAALMTFRSRRMWK